MPADSGRHGFAAIDASRRSTSRRSRQPRTPRRRPSTHRVRARCERTPKGSFYHHFKDKEDFALQVVDQYMLEVHAGLDACLGDRSRLPLERVRCFFETTQQQYRTEGYMGCLLGGLGQELSGVSEVFRRKIDECFSEIAERVAVCLDEARQRGDIPADSDARHMASLLVDCWEGAALRSRLRREAAPLNAMLDFYFRSAIAS